MESNIDWATLTDITKDKIENSNGYIIEEEKRQDSTAEKKIILEM